MEATQSHVVNMFAMAIADGTVTPEELAVIVEVGVASGLTAAQIDEIIANPHRIRFAPPPSLVDKIAQLYDLARVLVTDGRIDPREVDTLRGFARRFGLSRELAEGVVAGLVDEVRAGTPREVLVSTVSSEIGL